MIKYKELLNNSMSKNFISLMTLQIINYFIPLITVPYITRTLGAGNFGLVNFAMAFMGYFVILTSYSFNLTATRDISVHRNDQEKVSQIFGSVLVTKVILTILSFLLLVIIVFAFELFRSQALVYFISFGLVIGSTFYPVWFFQGVEKMTLITVINIIVRGILIVFIFLFVKTEQDYLIYALLNSLNFIIMGIISIFIIMKSLKVKFYFPTFKEMKDLLHDGFLVFLSAGLISFYTTSPIFILGIITNPVRVGLFSGADKIRMAIQGLFTPIFQVVYPYVNNLATKSKEKFITFIKYEFYILTGIAVIGSFMTFFLADFLVMLLLGEGYEGSVILLKILAFIPIFVVLGNILAIQTLLSFNYKKYYSLVYIISSNLGIVIIFILTLLLGEVGTTISILVIEVIVVTLSLYFINKKKLFIKKI